MKDYVMEREEYLDAIRSHLGTAYNMTNDKIDSVLPRFLDMLSSHLTRLEELVDKDSPDALGKAGHTLKGALLNLGLYDLAQQALIIEQRCKTPGMNIDYGNVISTLKSEINQFARP